MKKLRNLLLILFVMILVPAVANAQVVEYDNNLTLRGTHNSSKLVLANTLTNNAEVDGIAGFAGNKVTGKGKVTYGAYAGNLVTISDEVEKDLFVAGNMVTITEDAVLNRDVFVAGNGITVNADVSRDLRVAGSTVEIGDITVQGNAKIYADSIVFNKDAKINGTLIVPEEAQIIGLEKSMYSKIKKVKTADIEIEEPTFKDKISNVVFSVISNYVTLLIILLVFTKVTKKIRKIKVDAKAVGSTALKGFGALVLVPIATIIVMCTGVLVFAGLINLALYISALYVSYLLGLFIVGEYIWKQFSKKENVFIESLIGVLVVKLLSLIPIIGGLVFAIVFFYGIGLLYNLITESIK